MSASGFVVLGAPMAGVRRALKLQQAQAVFGPAGKRRVRIFGREVDAAALTQRISRARLLAFVEGEDLVVLAVWRAGKLKVEVELPRVLRAPDELKRGAEAARKLAAALEGEAPGAMKSGTSALDVGAGIAGVSALELRGLSLASLLATRDELAAKRRALAGYELRVLEGLRVLEPDGAESPLLPEWAEPQRPLVTRGLTRADELLERLEDLDPDALAASHRQELEAIARGDLPFPVSVAEREQLIARARVLLG